MSGGGNGNDGGDDDDPLFELKLSMGSGPSMEEELRGKPSLSMQRQAQLDEGLGDLSKLHQSLDHPVGEILAELGITDKDDQKTVIQEFVEDAFREGGPNAKVTHLQYIEETGELYGRVNEFFDASVYPETFLEQHHAEIAKQALTVEAPPVQPLEPSAEISSAPSQELMPEQREALKTYTDGRYEHYMGEVQEEMAELNTQRNAPDYYETTPEADQATLNERMTELSQARNRLYDIADRPIEEQAARFEDMDAAQAITPITPQEFEKTHQVQEETSSAGLEERLEATDIGEATTTINEEQQTQVNQLQESITRDHQALEDQLTNRIERMTDTQAFEQFNADEQALLHHALARAVVDSGEDSVNQTSTTTNEDGTTEYTAHAGDQEISINAEEILAQVKAEQLEAQNIIDAHPELAPDHPPLEDSSSTLRAMGDFIHPGLGDTLEKGADTALDAFDTSAALAETIIKGTVNFGSKMGANVASLAVGGIHAVKEGSLDEGINAMRSVRTDMMNDMHIDTSDFAKEQLSEGAIAEIGLWLNDKGEAAYDAIEAKYGFEVAELAKGAAEAGLDIAGILGAGAATKGLSGAARGTKGVAQATNPIYLKTNDITKIYESGRIWGQTEGSVYGMTKPNAPIWRTTIDPKKIDVGTIILEGEAAALFKPHPIEGVFSGIKRGLGQHKAPFGDVVFNKGTATFDKATGVLTIKEAAIGSHAGQSTFQAASRLWGRRILVEGAIAAPIGVNVYFTNKEPD